MKTAKVKTRRLLGEHRFIDLWGDAFYCKRQFIGGLWYLYDASGHVQGAYAKEDIKF